MTRASTNRAFTLIEVLAATALSVVLMLAVLSAIAAIGQDQHLAVGEDTKQSRNASIIELLRWDLTNARQMRLRKDGLVLEGLASLDQTTRDASLSPATVVYRVQPAGPRSWLVRQQTSRTGNGAPVSWTEIVCPDIQGLKVEPLRKKEARVQSGVPANATESIPDAVRVTLRPIEGGGPSIDRVIILR